MQHCLRGGFQLRGLVSHEALLPGWARAQELLPSVHLFKLSVGALNNTVLIPRKDYVQNRLVAGMLQLPAGTELLVDETQMDEGQLTERGVAKVFPAGAAFDVVFNLAAETRPGRAKLCSPWS